MHDNGKTSSVRALGDSEIISFVPLAIAMQHLYTFHERVRSTSSHAYPNGILHIFFSISISHFLIFSENFSSYT